MSLIAGRAGSNFASYQEVVSIPVPTKTNSYAPISNRDLIDLIEEKAQRITGFEVANRQFVLGAKGNQMFGSVALRTGDEDRHALLGFANSYDKTLSVRIVSGASIMVCSNMCISGSDFTSKRKHTSGVVEEIEGLVVRAVEAATDNYQSISTQLDEWKSREMEWHRGAELLGIAFFDGVMSPRQMSIAMNDWKSAKDGAPRHREFAEPTVYSLYNCMTEGLKNGPASSVTDRYREAHEWMEQIAA
tara:strand:+ start:2610 stop:3347 length:738 start_codon:yes stop_codon:yes gene_type:complete